MGLSRRSRSVLGVPQVARHERGSQHEGEDHRRGARGRRAPPPRSRRAHAASTPDHSTASRQELASSTGSRRRRIALCPARSRGPDRGAGSRSGRGGRRRILIVGPSVPVEHLDAVIALERAAVEKRPHRDPRAIDDPNGRVVAGPPLTPLDPRPLIGVRRERLWPRPGRAPRRAARLLDQRQRAEAASTTAVRRSPRGNAAGRVGTCLHGRRLPWARAALSSPATTTTSAPSARPAASRVDWRDVLEPEIVGYGLGLVLVTALEHDERLLRGRLAVRHRPKLVPVGRHVVTDLGREPRHGRPVEHRDLDVRFTTPPSSTSAPAPSRRRRRCRRSEATRRRRRVPARTRRRLSTRAAWRWGRG